MFRNALRHFAKTFVYEKPAEEKIANRWHRLLKGNNNCRHTQVPMSTWTDIYIITPSWTPYCLDSKQQLCYIWKSLKYLPEPKQPMPVPHAARSTHRSAAARQLRLWVRTPPGAWMFVCCECWVMSGRGLCDELITRPEESCRLWCVVVWDLETSGMRWPWPTGGCRVKNKQKQPLLKKEKTKKNSEHSERGDSMYQGLLM